MKYLKLVRPKQWIKNSLVFAPIIFSGQLLSGQYITAFYAAIIFIITSSCVYIFNDIHDYDSDRHHNTNIMRPIASGNISIKNAYIFLLILIIFDSLLIYIFSISFEGIGLVIIYLFLNFLYSVSLKNIPLLEILIVSSGFIIRLLFGAIETSIILSPWIILCLGVFVLMITVGKRRSDYVQNINSKHRRKSLDGYNLKYLDQIITIFASATIMLYLLYATSDYAESSIGLSVVWTSPIVIFAILRYLQLVTVYKNGEDPTSMLLRDKVSLILFIIWILSILCIIYFF